MATYKESGVDKEEGYRTISKIRDAVQRTHNRYVLNGLGSFGSFYKISGYQTPVLVSGVDGVGTKLRLALDHKKYETIGIDCFAMCANDILCHGAKPLFFLDYLACGKLDADVASEIIQGMAKACESTGAAFIGGETSEMPGMYQNEDYDVAGFCVGVVEHQYIIDGSQVRQGDVLIGLPSSGVHSNGFSLIRKIFSKDDLSKDFGGKPLYETLLVPTRLYNGIVHGLLGNFSVHGLAHITGGGLYENVPRIIPNGLSAVIRKKKIPVPPVFDYILKIGSVPDSEMWGTFNMGIGMVLVVAPKDQSSVLAQLDALNEEAFVIGNIKKGNQKITLI
ncbi:MAG: phosphoribosylformylglycinamidine cyclo-ligase [Flavobacteriales bacterium Tduv]